jgi:hypothetical protein
MGVYSGGILGSFSGKIGAVIGSNWKGIGYMRGRAAKSKRTPSQKQEDQRLKFGLVVLFLDVITAYLDITFKNYAVQMTANNAAFSYNIGNVITGLSPAFKLDYSKAVVSRGKLLNAGSPAVAIVKGNANFSWSDNSGAGNALATDNAMPLVYCAALNQCSYSGTALRSDGAASVDVSLFAGQTVETWLAFVSADRTDASMSVFLGEMSV